MRFMCILLMILSNVRVDSKSFLGKKTKTRELRKKRQPKKKKRKKEWNAKRVSHFNDFGKKKMLLKKIRNKKCS